MSPLLFLEQTETRYVSVVFLDTAFVMEHHGGYLLSIRQNFYAEGHVKKHPVDI